MRWRGSGCECDLDGAIVCSDSFMTVEQEILRYARENAGEAFDEIGVTRRSVQNRTLSREGAGTFRFLTFDLHQCHAHSATR